MNAALPGVPPQAPAGRYFSPLMEMKAAITFSIRFAPEVSPFVYMGAARFAPARCADFDFQQDDLMKPSKLSILAIALTAATLTFAGGCNRSDKAAYTDKNKNEPATTASTTPETTAPYTTAPAATPATSPPPAIEGTNTAATDTSSVAGTQSMTPTPSPTTGMTGTTKTTADATTSFDDLDTNHDGAISRDELTDTNPLLQSFSAADKDGNGTLSRTEVDAQRGKMPPKGG